MAPTGATSLGVVVTSGGVGVKKEINIATAEKDKDSTSRAAERYKLAALAVGEELFY